MDGKIGMKTPKPSPTTPSEDPDLELARRLDEEQRAIEESLREYLDGRLAGLARSEAAPRLAGSLFSGPGTADVRGDRRPHGNPWAWRSDAYFFIVLACLGALWWRVETLTAPLKPVAQATAAGAEVPVRIPRADGKPASGIARPEAAVPAVRTPPVYLDDPAAGWDAHVRARPAIVATWLRAVAEHRGLPPNRVSDRQKANFARWAAVLERDGALSRPQNANVRLGLFEYAYGRWLSERAQPPPGDPAAWERVDLVIGDGEYSPQALAALVADLGLEAWFGTPDPEDPALQVAVAAAWIDARQARDGANG